MTPVYVAAEDVLNHVTKVNAHAPEIRKNARIMDELDVAIAYANLAEEMNLVRPTITEE